LLTAPDGRPRIAILSIAHLGESERMFFVTTLLNEVVSWVRSQSGTSSLRALLYMDEIFGYFPPTAAPPSKKPMLTLLKQARASGLGILLATQNPADLDYKGLANTGTWFLGRLQTERDKLRVLEGLEGAAAATGAAFDAREMDEVLAGLPGRVFLAHNVHEDAPLLFQTRWAMSYLRGPLQREQIQRLMAARRNDEAAVPAPAAAVALRLQATPAAAGAESRPILPPGIEERFLPAARPVGDHSRLVYRPRLLASARVHFVKAAASVDHWQERLLVAPPPAADSAPEWKEIALAHPRLGWGGLDAAALESAPIAGAAFEPAPAPVLRAKSWTAWSKQLEAALYRDQRLVLWKSAAVGAQSSAGESEGDFRARLAHLARERRDHAVEELRRRYAPKIAALEEKVRRGEERVEREQSQVGRAQRDTMISIGATIAGALFGRKLASVTNVTRARSTLRGASRASQEKDDVARAERGVETAREDLTRLEADLARDLAATERSLDPAAVVLEKVELAPRKTDVEVVTLLLLWTPWRLDPSGTAEPLFDA
jgi:hypothetical protein